MTNDPTKTSTRGSAPSASLGIAQAALTSPELFTLTTTFASANARNIQAIQAFNKSLIPLMDQCTALEQSWNNPERFE
jgi:hypothetical protein